jgi:hypothetical protein
MPIGLNSDSSTVNVGNGVISVNTTNSRVGIGTNNPTQPLDVVGNLNVSGGIIPSSPFSFRNKIINGNFDFWQRGTSFTQTTSVGYTADRWTSNFNGSGGTRIISRQAFTVGQNEVPHNPKYFVRFNQSVAGSGATFNVLSHRVEGVETLAGKTATLSFWVRCSSGTLTSSIAYGQVFGTGGSPSAIVGIGGGFFSITTTWTKITLTTNLPSIAGKTLGTNQDNFLYVEFILPLNTTFTIDIAQVQLEEGSVATPFEVRPLGTELALCQRYYQKSYDIETNPTGITFNGYFISFSHNTFTLQQTNIRFQTPMRRVPSVTLYSSNTGASGRTYNVVTATDTVTNTVNIGNNGFEVNGSNNFTSGNYYTFHYAADAEF